MNTKLYLSSAYLAPVQYYQKLISNQDSVIEQYDNYIKQTYRNRCHIVGAEGLQNLTIPTVKATTPKVLMKDVEISEHGNWKHLHWNAIVSAYNNSPYFEFYADEFAPYFHERNFKYLLDLNESLQTLIFELLDCDKSYSYSEEYKTVFGTEELDLREVIHPKKSWLENDSSFQTAPYHQVFREKHGFIPNLSIIDLLFNKGPESVFYLDLSFIDKVK